MLINILVLFFSTFLAGMSVLLVPTHKTINFKLILVFAGAYLFSITIIHILPELFVAEVNIQKIGIFILLGFFMQVFIDYFSSGIEHGHGHHHHQELNNGHHHGSFSPISLLLALCLHSFLEGTLLAHPSTLHEHHNASALLIGIVLHEMPAAFALMSVLLFQFQDKRKASIFLLLFCLASPAGLVLSHYFHAFQLISDYVFLILYALVSGNFLHISTTIFFETSPEHKFHAKKLIISVAGALIAVLAESFI